MGDTNELNDDAWEEKDPNDAPLPKADADAGEPQSVGGSLEGRVVGQSEEDADAAGEADGRGLATTQLFQRGALACGEGDARGTRAAHNRTRFSWQDCYPLLVYPQDHNRIAFPGLLY